MPAPFKRITIEQFAELLSSFPFKRHINAVHMHHTWRPNHAQFRGHETIVAMWRFHTQENHWSDIAQHITIDNQGMIWLGRNWNQPPASAAGHNGNAQAGPFMFEMIGDFDKGKDSFGGAQRATVLEVIARVQRRFGLAPSTLQFHNMMSAKTCPGNGIDYQAVLREVEALHARLAEGGRDVPPPDQPFPRDQQADAPAVREAIEDLLRDTGRALDPPDAEPCAHEARHEARYGARYEAHCDGGDGMARDGARGIRFGAAELQAMRPHVVNLRMGQFSSGGDWSTEESDVDAIFEVHLPAALEKARQENRPLKLMFYAHGGLTSEADALAKARDYIGWWKDNGIYPLHFVWETGLCETLGQILERWKQGRGRAARNFFSDHLWDPGIEAFSHLAGGVGIWSAMKWSAQQASAANGLGGAADAPGARPGGACYVARKLKAFLDKHPANVELHAAGHSAGSIFHAHFIPCALALGVPGFDSLHLMAPAVRVDLFRQQLQHLVGQPRGIGKLTMYTMWDSFERDDNCAAVYRKSLLYLVHKALEPEVDEPILGLERCVRNDAGLKALFGLDGGRGAAEVVWSDNGIAQGRSASRSRSHGGFDDDAATMGSIVRRVLGRMDADRIVELPQARRVVDPWLPSIDYQDLFWGGADGGAWDGGQPGAQPAQPPGMAPGMAPGMPPTSAPSWAWSAPQPGLQPIGQPAERGKRVALCVGIDTYPTAPLGGCVNDARAWADALARLGFDTSRTLFNQQATRDAIMAGLSDLVGQSRAGDVIVFQYAGHGTQVPDLDGDEAGGDTPGEDEALCPYDFASGELVVDDDMRAVFRRLPDGVNLTCFFDCCHSGTITRFAVGARPGGATPSKRARFIRASDELVANYQARRRAMRNQGFRAPPGGSLETMREVVFSACLSSEVALESNGHGDFTRCAMQVFGQDVSSLSNRAFAERVTRAFGSAPQQHAKLYSSEEAGMRTLLAPLGAPARGRAAADGLASEQERAELAAHLLRASQILVNAPAPGRYG